jgi:hypothetical protein
MPTDSTSIWLSAAVTLLVAIISQAIRERGYFKYTKPAQNDDLTAQTRTVNLLRIEQREPNRRPPRYISPVLMVCAILLLAFGIWAIYLWITGIIKFQLDFRVVLFFVGFSAAFLVFPLYILIDYFYTQPRYNRRGRSHVAKEAIVTVAGDVDVVFDACYRVLDSMQAAMIILERPNLFRAKVRNSVMTIVIRQIEGSKVRVYVVSDSKWLTVKWDMGANQKNVDDFLRELGKQ